VKINGITHYRWRVVDLDGEVLEVVSTKQHNTQAALKFLRKLIRRYGRLRSIATDRLRTYAAALRATGATHLPQCCSRWINNRAKKPHRPLRRRVRALLQFRSMQTLQKFAPVHAAVHNHFNHASNLVRGQIYKKRRSAALTEWGAMRPGPAPPSLRQTALAARCFDGTPGSA
jgi:putative transposase